MSLASEKPSKGLEKIAGKDCGGRKRKGNMRKKMKEVINLKWLLKFGELVEALFDDV